MPNHITNVLRINVYKHEGHDPALVDEILDAIKGADSPIDFNRLIPMPPELEIDSNGKADEAHLANIAKHGHPDWYTWSIEKWGTKWNAYSAIAGKCRDGEGWLHFETAWSPPLPVLDALAAKFPQSRMRLIWCDEGDDRQNRVYWGEGKRESDDE